GLQPRPRVPRRPSPLPGAPTGGPDDSGVGDRPQRIRPQLPRADQRSARSRGVQELARYGGSARPRGLRPPGRLHLGPYWPDLGRDAHLPDSNDPHTKKSVQINDPLALEGDKNWSGMEAQLGREVYALQVDRTWVRTGLISAVSPTYRLRVTRKHKMPSTNTAVTVKGGWRTAGDNTMGIKVQSNGMLKIQKAGLYNISYAIRRYNSPIKVSDASVTLAIGGVWVHPMFEEHRNSNWQGVESTMFWSGILNAGDVIDPRAGQWNAKKQKLEYTVEMEIEMVG